MCVSSLCLVIADIPDRRVLVEDATGRRHSAIRLGFDDLRIEVGNVVIVHSGYVTDVLDAIAADEVRELFLQARALSSDSHTLNTVTLEGGIPQ